MALSNHGLIRLKNLSRKFIVICVISYFFHPVRQAVSAAYKPAVAVLLWEKNIVPRLISHADKLSRTGCLSTFNTLCMCPNIRCDGMNFFLGTTHPLDARHN
jgi:hypothetical protein